MKHEHKISFKFMHPSNIESQNDNLALKVFYKYSSAAIEIYG